MKVNIVLDVEMCKVSSKTRRYPYKSEIIQIGAVMMDENWEMLDSFSAYVKPRYGKINHFILSLTGISERDIKNAPDIGEALQQMLQWIGENEATFYSWSATDYYQIRNEIQLKCLAGQECQADPESSASQKYSAGQECQADPESSAGQKYPASQECRISQEDSCWDVLLDAANWVDYQEKFGKRLDYSQPLKLSEALDLAEIETEGHLHDGLDDARNTARMIAKLEQQKNYQTLIERIRAQEEAQKPLTSSLGDCLKGLVLEPA